MTQFPSGLRFAEPGDERRLYDLFVMAHSENGMGDVDPETVRAVIVKGCAHEDVAIALADGPERIEAAIGLHPVKRWYSTDAVSNWYSEDLLIYVHPLHRRSRHARALLQFAQFWAEKSEMPVVLGLMPKDDFEGKEAFFERFARRVGGIYMIGGEKMWPESRKAA